MEKPLRLKELRKKPLPGLTLSLDGTRQRENGPCQEKSKSSTYDLFEAIIFSLGFKKSFLIFFR